MKNIKRLIFVTLLTFNAGITFSQTKDSLSVIPEIVSTSSTIHFTLVKSDTISLQVFNMLGEIEKTYFQSTFLPSGSYNINLAGDGLKEGVYIVKLDIGSTKSIAKRIIRIDVLTSIYGKGNGLNLILSPNPTNEFINVPIEGYKSIIVTDQNGKIVKSLTTDQKSVSLLNLPNGQYLVTILTDKKELLTTQKIVKSE